MPREGIEWPPLGRSTVRRPESIYWVTREGQVMLDILTEICNQVEDPQERIGVLLVVLLWVCRYLAVRHWIRSKWGWVKTLGYANSSGLERSG